MEDTITLRIPEEMKQALDEICNKEGNNLSVVVRRALKQLISIHKFEQLRKDTIPFAEKVGVYSDEDILDLPS